MNCQTFIKQLLYANVLGWGDDGVSGLPGHIVLQILTIQLVLNVHKAFTQHNHMGKWSEIQDLGLDGSGFKFLHHQSLTIIAINKLFSYLIFESSN